MPFAGGPDGIFAFEIASILVDHEEGKVIPLNVTSPGRKTHDIEAFLDDAVQSRNLDKKIFKPNYKVSKNVVETIVNEANEGDYDLVIIGASRERQLKQMVRGSIPEQIARRCEKPLIMVKSVGGLRLFIKRII